MDKRSETTTNISFDENISSSSLHTGEKESQRTSTHGLYTAEELSTIIREAYVPRISVICSRDADEFAINKGFPQGFWELLYPFGDRVRGKVRRRDMQDAMLTLDKTSLQFVPVDSLESHLSDVPVVSIRDILTAQNPKLVLPEAPSNYTLGVHYKNVERWAWTLAHEENREMSIGMYIRQLLTGMPVSSFETFSHPVAHLVVVTSHNPTPFESLREIINSLPQISLPAFVSHDIIYFFVYVHDEDQHDIELSMAIFDTMLQTFGERGYFLRLHSQKATLDYEHTIPFPCSSWLSAEERLQMLNGLEKAQQLLFQSDAESLKRLVSHIAFNGVIPHLDRCIRIWDDQYASPRRGFTGRLFFASKKLISAQNNSHNSNFFASSNVYRPDSIEAYLRKLADYSFMLRDYVHANQIYEIASKQYANDDAYLYSAAASEMIVITEHILHLDRPYMSLTNKLRLNECMQLAMANYLNKPFNSYYHAARCFLLLGQYLSSFPNPRVDDAANWNTGLLFSKRLGPVGRAIVFQQTYELYRQTGRINSDSLDSREMKRDRKTAFWCVMAADAWLRCHISFRARPFIDQAKDFYTHVAWQDLNECVAKLGEVDMTPKSQDK
ncbi:TRAPP complex subunit Trs85 [Schizosaccharomyces cryophilus OY26]|uniref:TRAPP complex subunit Trs85 n=1 Tax=Schizosaccharomyces cryophilus (strain OY26 / ATCC MYA-4695 / CBS 11777 / NBRC 106824 / NRRL Y48691) TaxID=653667 RepID=S9VTN2_SCHCR|nr:TRAPP complex subunit Trs85 [Schizosaccharomyces cryophilus OY26]EPY49405.1 TRAPP complex subunit Trs85 [Schizosaccharomyces cryophilus OY26]